MFKTSQKSIDRDHAGQIIGGLRRKAETLVKDPARVAKLLEAAAAKAELQSEQVVSFKSHLTGLMRMVKAWVGGQYRAVPWSTLIMAVAGILYFVNPLDVIPDFIVGAGFLDDATVLMFVFKALKRDIEHFFKWEQQKSVE